MQQFLKGINGFNGLMVKNTSNICNLKLNNYIVFKFSTIKNHYFQYLITFISQVLFINYQGR
jgi:hypothetical protein